MFSFSDRWSKTFGRKLFSFPFNCPETSTKSTDKNSFVADTFLVFVWQPTTLKLLIPMQKSYRELLDYKLYLVSNSWHLKQDILPPPSGRHCPTLKWNLFFLWNPRFERTTPVRKTYSLTWTHFQLRTKPVRGFTPTWTHLHLVSL